MNYSYANDESISNYETHAFNPITGKQLNNLGSITITVQNSMIIGIIQQIAG